jgi:hypothetical protein
MKPPAPLLAATLVATAVSAAAAADAPIRLDLNRLEDADGACRAYLVGDSSERLDTLTLDLVLFDADGVISRRLAVEAGPIRAGRPSVSAFVIEGAACAGVARVLVNDVLACAGAAGPVEGCLDRIEATSRAGVAFID